MLLETRKYRNDDEMMTVVKLKTDEGKVIDTIKVYNDLSEVSKDKDLRWTAENIDEFLLKIYRCGQEGGLEFDSQLVNV